MTARHDQFHLLIGPADWQIEQQTGVWWDEAHSAVSLRPHLHRYARKSKGVARHRGAARDRNGAWYWVAADGRTLMKRAPGETGPTCFWPPEGDPDPDGHGGAHAPGAFHALLPPKAAPPTLQGLTITDDDCLVVGLPETNSLLRFNLASPAPPVAVPLPARPLKTVAMAPLRGGGVMLLADDQPTRLWLLDRNCRPVGDPAVLPAELRPLALTLLPDGSALVLGESSPASTTVVIRCVAGMTAEPVALKIHDETLPAYDIAFLPDPEPDAALPAGSVSGVLYAAGIRDEQCFAFRLVTGPKFGLTLQTTCLPTPTSQALGIVATGGEVYYDARDEWLPLRAEPPQHYATRGEIILPRDPKADVPEGVFDGKAPDCVWHRIFVDASIPPGTEITIATRAMNKETTMDDGSFQLEPALHLRPGGSELPYAPSLAASDEQPGQRPDTGTWEVLLQKAVGQYLQVRIRLRGSGRATPRIYALRAYYPRFSYVREYLPGIYQDDTASASFLERFLANPEGLLTDIARRIASTDMLFDARTAPADYLGWLAGWFGLGRSLHWEEQRQRLFIQHAVQLYRSRGTLPGLVRALRLGTDPNPTGAIFTDDITPYSGRGTPGNGRRPAFRIVEDFDGSHHFTVYLMPVPHSSPIDPERVRQLVVAQQPAHTRFDIQPDWAAFRVGSAHLGADTILAESGRIAAMRLGHGALGESYLTMPI